MKTRIITGIVAMVLFIPFVMYGGLPFYTLLYVAGTIGLYELLRMKNIHMYFIPSILSILLLWITLIPSQYAESLESMGFVKMELTFIIVLLLLTYTVISKNKFTFDDSAFLLLATIYVGMGFYYFIETRVAGLEYIVFTLIVIWSTDSGAYFVGKSIGKNKLWPQISPNKTIEGFLGGIASAIVAAIIFQFAAITFQFVQPLPVSFGIIIISAMAVSIFGQLGDLVESAFKRHYDVKDSGKILPGHGGVLDRFDSLLFALPILHFLQLMF
jgi:phosphatidate cytidylyltransferase